MVDAVEEDYRFETLPHASASDRAEMVARKLKQHYRNTPYMAAWLLGRETDKRRDDRYLFSALTNPDLIADWLQPVAARELPIARDYLLPMVSAAWLEKLEREGDQPAAGGATSQRLAAHVLPRRASSGSRRLTRGDSGRPENRAGRCLRA